MLLLAERITPLLPRLTNNDRAGMNWQHSREIIARAVKERAEALLAAPVPPGLIRLIPDNPYFYGNEAAYRYFWGRRAGVKNFTPVRPADKCMQHQPHRCFQPVGETTDWYVHFYEPLDPSYLPSREFQPEWIRREYQVRFCCSDAAFIYAQKVEREGRIDVRISHGDEMETVGEYKKRFFGAEPCWK